MATNSADVLKSFLVSIGFKVDEAGYKKLREQVGALTERVVELGIEATAAATAFGYAANRIASDLDRLYYASQRTGTSAMGLKAFGLAAQAAGMNYDQAIDAAARLQATIRNTPGRLQMLNAMGVDTSNGGANALTSLVSILNAKEKAMGGGVAAHQVASTFAQMFGGIDEETYTMMSKNAVAMEKQKKALNDWMKSMGLSEKSLKDNTEAGHEFMMHWNLMLTKFGIAADVIGGRLLPVLQPFLDFVSKLADFLILADGKTGGASSWVAALIAVLGGGAAAKGALGFVGRGLGLRGGGAAAGEAVAGEELVAGGAVAGEAGGLALGPIAVAAAVMAALAWVVTHPSDVANAVKGVVSFLTDHPVEKASKWLDKQDWMLNAERQWAQFTGASPEKLAAFDAWRAGQKNGTVSSGAPSPLLESMGKVEGFGADPSNIPTRLNNPGDLRFASWMTKYGATEDSSGFAKFPSAQAGYSAMAALLASKSYAGMTLSQMVNKYAPKYDNRGRIVNNPDAYIASITHDTGILPGQVLTPGMTGAGGAGTSNEINIHVHGTQHPGAIADEVSDKVLAHLRQQNQRVTRNNTGNGGAR